jgi:transcriptional regulator with XRE-family HTH domain
MAASSSASHPLDTELRARLRAIDPPQRELAERIGRKPAWLNKYMHGAGHATIDDVIRIVAVLSEVEALSELERRVVRGLRRLKDSDRQHDVLWYLERVVMRRKGSSAPGGQTRRGATRKGPGKP